MIHHRNHIALLIIAIAITLVVCALYAYMRYAIGSSLSRAAEARIAAQNEQTYQSQRQNLMGLYNDTQNNRAKLAGFFVADDQKVTFIEKIESFGATTQAKVVLGGIVADDLATSPVGTLGRMSMHVDATGSWSSVMRVLKMAETLPYKSSVTGVRVDVASAGEGKDAKRQWHVSFMLDAVSIRRAI